MAASASKPNHRTVKQLCKNLGYYEADDKDNARYFRRLSTPTRNHRRAFINGLPASMNFPLNHTDPQAQRCASNFLTENADLFSGTEESVANIWPSYPSDEDRQAFLMAIQTDS
jgi:hypothetical protein